MKKIGCKILLLWLPFSGLLHAFHMDDLPDQMHLTQNKANYTTSFDIETKTKKFGTLYRIALSLPLTYDFYDSKNNLLTSTVRANWFSFGTQFEIYDAHKVKIGSVEEKIFTFFPGFAIYSTDSVQVARGEMNFWGTTFYVYDTLSDRLVAYMTRPFFRLKNAWSIEIKNKKLLKERHINLDLFMTALAFQADREYWGKQRQNNLSTEKKDNNIIVRVNEKIVANMEKYLLRDIPLMDSTQLETLAARLENDYQNQVQDDFENVDDNCRVYAFVNFCLDFIQSNDVLPVEKKGVLYLLHERMNA